MGKKIISSGMKTLQKKIQHSRKRSMYDPVQRAYRGPKGGTGSDIPNDLMTRAKAGKRGTLGISSKQKKKNTAAAIKAQNLANKAGELNRNRTKYANPQMGGRQVSKKVKL